MQSVIALLVLLLAYEASGLLSPQFLSKMATGNQNARFMDTDQVQLALAPRYPLPAPIALISNPYSCIGPSTLRSMLMAGAWPIRVDMWGVIVT